MLAESGIGILLETLLKRPAHLVAALQQANTLRLSFLLTAFALVAFAAYGLVVGSFSGGTQLLAAPVKISLGALASMLICLPSLFIFACLTGAEVSLRATFGILGAVLALAALLLIGFAPAVWVFSESTDSIAFIGGLHLLFWLIGLGFGLRLIGTFLDQLRIRDRTHLRIWSVIFVLVSLQMTTALRPIIGTSDHWLPVEKKFFLAHWVESLFHDVRQNPAE